MFYMIYLFGVIFLFMDGIGVHRFLTDYMDAYTWAFILIPCLLVLFCTKSFKAFGRAFLSAFGIGNDSQISHKESIQAVRMVMATAVVFGCIGFLVGVNKSIGSQNFSSPDAFGWIFRDVTVAMLSLFYPLLVCMILLPVFFILKKRIEEK